MFVRFSKLNNILDDIIEYITKDKIVYTSDSRFDYCFFTPLTQDECPHIETIKSIYDKLKYSIWSLVSHHDEISNTPSISFRFGSIRPMFIERININMFIYHILNLKVSEDIEHRNNDELETFVDNLKNNSDEIYSVVHTIRALLIASFVLYSLDIQETETNRVEYRNKISSICNFIMNSINRLPLHIIWNEYINRSVVHNNNLNKLVYQIIHGDILMYLFNNHVNSKNRLMSYIFRDHTKYKTLCNYNASCYSSNRELIKDGDRIIVKYNDIYELKNFNYKQYLNVVRDFLQSILNDRYAIQSRLFDDNYIKELSKAFTSLFTSIESSNRDNVNFSFKLYYKIYGYVVDIPYLFESIINTAIKYKDVFKQYVKTLETMIDIVEDELDNLMEQSDNNIYIKIDLELHADKYTSKDMFVCMFSGEVNINSDRYSGNVEFISNPNSNYNSVKILDFDLSECKIPTKISSEKYYSPIISSYDNAIKCLLTNYSIILDLAELYKSSDNKLHERLSDISNKITVLINAINSDGGEHA